MTSASLPASSGSSASRFLPPSASAPSPAGSTSSTASSADALTESAVALRLRIHRFEQLLEDALIEGGTLLGDMFAARRAMGLSAVVGQPAIAAAVEAIDGLAAARGAAVKTHRLLDRMGQALGMDDPHYGDAGKDIFTTGALATRDDG